MNAPDWPSCKVDPTKVLPRGCLGGVVPKKIYLYPLTKLQGKNAPQAKLGQLSRDLDASILDELNKMLATLDSQAAQIGETSGVGGRLGSGGVQQDGLTAWTRINEEYRAKMVNYTLFLKQRVSSLVHQYRNGTIEARKNMTLLASAWQDSDYSDARFFTWWSDTELQLSTLITYRDLVTSYAGTALSSLAQLLQWRFHSSNGANCQTWGQFNGTPAPTKYCDQHLFVVVIKGMGEHGVIDPVASDMVNKFTVFQLSHRNSFDATKFMQFVFFHYESNCCDSTTHCVICDSKKNVPATSTILHFHNGELKNGTGPSGSFVPPTFPDTVADYSPDMNVTGDADLRSFHLSWTESPSGVSADWHVNSNSHLWKYKVEMDQIDLDTYGNPRVDIGPRFLTSQTTLLASHELYTRVVSNVSKGLHNDTKHPLVPSGALFCTPYRFTVTASNWDLDSEPSIYPQPYTGPMNGVVLLPLPMVLKHGSRVKGDNSRVTFDLALDPTRIAVKGDKNSINKKDCVTNTTAWDSGPEGCTTNFTNCAATIYQQNSLYALTSVYLGSSKEAAQPCSIDSRPSSDETNWNVTVTCPLDTTDSKTKTIWAMDQSSAAIWPAPSISFWGTATYLDDKAKPITTGPTGPGASHSDKSFCLTVRTGNTASRSLSPLWLDSCSSRDPTQLFTISPVTETTGPTQLSTITPEAPLKRQIHWPAGGFNPPQCVALNATSTKWTLNDCNAKPTALIDNEIYIDRIQGTLSNTLSNANGAYCFQASKGYELLQAAFCSNATGGDDPRGHQKFVIPDDAPEAEDWDSRNEQM
jgi:hypothetical protein